MIEQCEQYSIYCSAVSNLRKNASEMSPWEINKLCLEILKLNGIEEVKHSDIEMASAEFVKQMEGFSLDIELTDTDDLIIWGTFKED